MYKGNRTRPDPEHMEECRLHLINRWDATEAIGCESDDLVGCNQTENTIICGIDKDLLTIPGKHYQWPIFRGGKEIRPARFHEITYIEGMRTFFEQMLIGDSSDNIVGVTGLGKVKAAKELENCPTEVQMYERVRYLYVDQDRFYKNLDLLWIWRNLGETYSIRNEIRGIV
jgi:5'-3' exonuclease